jgi:hypothetical protein
VLRHGSQTYAPPSTSLLRNRAHRGGGELPQDPGRARQDGPSMLEVGCQTHAGRHHSRRVAVTSRSTLSRSSPVSETPGLRSRLLAAGGGSGLSTTPTRPNQPAFQVVGPTVHRGHWRSQYAPDRGPGASENRGVRRQLGRELRRRLVLAGVCSGDRSAGVGHCSRRLEYVAHLRTLVAHSAYLADRPAGVRNSNSLAKWAQLRRRRDCRQRVNRKRLCRIGQPHHNG